ncbi:MAG: hypothetical protein PHR69_05845, partial [Sphaerochaeta sp.]|nr:hypothetical protein [Sphaerochaeta sp.]
YSDSQWRFCNSLSWIFPVTSTDHYYYSYDNNTVDDLTDDISVLADKFWERIDINDRQYDKDGVELL